MKLDNIIEAVGNKTIRCLFVHIDLKEQFMSSLNDLFADVKKEPSFSIVKDNHIGVLGGTEIRIYTQETEIEKYRETYFRLNNVLPTIIVIDKES